MTDDMRGMTAPAAAVNDGVLLNFRLDSASPVGPVDGRGVAPCCDSVAASRSAARISPASDTEPPPCLQAAALAAGAPWSSAILNAMPQMVWLTRGDGIVDFANDRWRAFTGASGPAGAADQWLAYLHPDDVAAASQKWRESLASGTPYQAEARLRCHDGAYRWTLNRAVPVRAADGSIERWCGTFTDIDDLKTTQDELDFVACEQSHRIQNIFALVDGMLKLSSRSEPHAQAFADSACARIKALARANDYIRPHQPAGATSVHGLLAVLLVPYRPDACGPGAPPSVMVSGTDAAIGTAAATSLALVLHELATNAAKYGALSQAGGCLAVTTAIDPREFCLVWTETGGPALTGPPSRSGFGTILTDRALQMPLGGSLERTWAPTGLIVTIRIPVDRLRL